MYPIFLNLENKKCVVFGAGKTAFRRINNLIEEKADVTVVAPEKIPENLKKLPVKYIQEKYRSKFIENAFLVFASTDDTDINRKIIHDAREKNILVSSVNIEDSDFSVPAQCKNKTVCVAVSTDKKSPALAKRIKLQIKKIIDRYDDIGDILAEYRELSKNKIKNPNLRKYFLLKLVSDEMISVFVNSGKEEYIKMAEKVFDNLDTAIVVVSFGTTYKSSREKNIEAVENEIQSAYKDIRVCRAFTSRMVIDRIFKEENEKILTVSETLEQLKKDGIKKVYCQPTHIINGEEYDKIVLETKKYKKDFDVLKVGNALLTQTSDYRTLLDAIDGDIIKKSDDIAYILMGHGTSHFSNAVYPAFDHWLRVLDYDNVFMATVEEYPTLETAINQLDKNKNKWKKVVLVPFMLCAGEHALNDMAGEDENSWKNILIKNGYNVETNIKGLGENKKVREMYVQHLKNLIQS